MFLNEALISFTAFALLWMHLTPGFRTFVINHKGWFDFALHGTIIWLFMGSFEGLMQAECAAIMFSIALRVAGWWQRAKDTKPKPEPIKATEHNRHVN